MAWRIASFLLTIYIGGIVCSKKVIVEISNSSDLLPHLRTLDRIEFDISTVYLGDVSVRDSATSLCQDVLISDTVAVIGCLDERSEPDRNLVHVLNDAGIPFVCVDGSLASYKYPNDIYFGRSSETSLVAIKSFVELSVATELVLIGKVVQLASAVATLTSSWAQQTSTLITTISTETGNVPLRVLRKVNGTLPQTILVVAVLDREYIIKNRSLWNSTNVSTVDPLWILDDCKLAPLATSHLPGKVFCLESEATVTDVLQDSLLWIKKTLQKTTLGHSNQTCMHDGSSFRLERKRFVRQLLSEKMKGKSGHISFTAFRARNHFNYKVKRVSMTDQTQTLVGYIRDGVANISTTTQINPKQCADKNAVCVTVVHDPPFLKIGEFNIFYDKECTLEHVCYVPVQLNGSESIYEKRCCAGYVVDILLSLERDLRFHAEIYVRSERAYGSYDPKTKRWGGMVGDLVEGRADVALMGMTVSKVRSEAIDFTPAITPSKLVILMHASQAEVQNSLFGYLRHLNLELWLTLLFLSISMIFIIWKLDRTSPYGHFRANTEEEDRLSLPATFTYIWSSVFKLTLDGVAARSPSARTVYAIFSFATLVFIATYTANLIASLVQEKESFPITGIYDAKFQDASLGFKFATTAGGSIEAFFRRNKLPVFRNIAQNLRTVNSVKEGVDKLTSRELDAFIYETPQVTHQAATLHTESFRIVGPAILQSSLAFGIRKGSPWKTRLSDALLHYEQKGYYPLIEKKWFLDLRNDEKFIKAMDITHFRGLFLIFPFAVLVCLLTLVAENALHRSQNRVRVINVQSTTMSDFRDTKANQSEQ